MKLPKILYAYEDKDGDVSYYVASVDPGDQDQGIIGVYTLTDTLHVRHSLEMRRQGTKTWFKNNK
jgi:hypothetical protein